MSGFALGLYGWQASSLRLPQCGSSKEEYVRNLCRTGSVAAQIVQDFLRGLQSLAAASDRFRRQRARAALPGSLRGTAARIDSPTAA